MYVVCDAQVIGHFLINCFQDSVLECTITRPLTCWWRPSVTRESVPALNGGSTPVTLLSSEHASVSAVSLQSLVQSKSSSELLYYVLVWDICTKCAWRQLGSVLDLRVHLFPGHTLSKTRYVIYPMQQLECSAHSVWACVLPGFLLRIWKPLEATIQAIFCRHPMWKCKIRRPTWESFFCFGYWWQIMSIDILWHW